MEKKSKIGIACLGSAAALSLAAIPLVHAEGNLASATEGEHVWNHYKAKAPTYFEHGSKEFWACCTHLGDHSLTKPEGVEDDEGMDLPDEYFAALQEGDDRYVAQKEAALYYARIGSTSYSPDAGGVNFASKVSYSSISSIEFDLRVNGTETSWAGFGYSDNLTTASIYTNMKTVTPTGDSAWHHYSIDMGGASGYVFFIEANGEFGTGENAENLDLANISIHYGSSQTATETFPLGKPALFDSTRFLTAVTIEAEETAISYDYKVKLTPNTTGGEGILLCSNLTYSSLTQVSFKVNVVTSSAADAWWGVELNSEKSYYNMTFRNSLTASTRPQGTTDGWKTYTYKDVVPADNYWWLNISGSTAAEKDGEGNWTQSGACYIYFVASTDISEMYLDDISFIADGTTYTEDFNSGSSSLFTLGKGASLVC